MLRRRLLFCAGLIALLAALFTASLAGAASAASVGPAYFVKATGGLFKVPVHANGFTVYSSSPAYLVLRADSSDPTAAIESDAARHNFPWVAVADTMRGRAGMDCFSNAHLVIAKSRVDAFTENHITYQGMFLQYLSWHFTPGAKKPTDCAPRHGGLTAAPSVAVGRTSVNLHIDCLVKRCEGTFETYSPSRLCQHPVRVVGGQSGCLPVVNGRFTMDGGLSVNFKVPLKGRPPSALFAAITVNGSRSSARRLSSLPRVYTLPAKQRAASLSLTCPTGGTIGTPVTISGRVSPGGAPAPVTLTFAGPNSTQSVTAVADASGAFTAPFTPSGGPAWVLDAVFAGDRTRTHASRTCAFSVTP
jgi:hypothetical protein